MTLFLSALYLVPWAAGHLGWYARDGYREFLFYAPFHQLLLIGPCIYLYVSTLLNSRQGVPRRRWWHFLPAALYLAYSLLMCIADLLVLDTPYFYADGRDRDLDSWYQIVGLLSLIVYTGLSISRYRLYRRDIVLEVSYADAVTYRWVRQYLVILLFLVGLRLVFLVAYPEFGAFGPMFWYYLIFGLVSSAVGLAGYTEAVRREVSRSLAVPMIADDLDADPSSSGTYPDIDAVDLQRWKPDLLALMERELAFRDPGLSLSDLAGRMDLSRRQTSALINREFGQNFNDFVNSYRVRAVRHSLAAEEHVDRTLLGVALDAGFNSKTTFNRVFKRETGQTPRQYVASLPKT
ncbi:helix-turn-helix domain-containing protein [Lewinella sp. IMCC34191]|uniref:helix-turn-helix domain-containing protein n=1 Tax=Lewinella sp. IMCC34191 TaxID=2259172 RepID=UPI00130098DA|nr:helix-turn-helix domain-containing protein [Lewinella sp. IMCC34191]